MTRRKKRDAREKNTGNTRSGRARSSPETARLGLGTRQKRGRDVQDVAADPGRERRRTVHQREHAAHGDRAEGEKPGALVERTMRDVVLPRDARADRLPRGRLAQQRRGLAREGAVAGSAHRACLSDERTSRPGVRRGASKSARLVGRYVLLAPRRKKCSRKNAISRKGFQSPKKRKND
jgi:hypothetical protein